VSACHYTHQRRHIMCVDMPLYSPGTSTSNLIGWLQCLFAFVPEFCLFVLLCFQLAGSMLFLAWLRIVGFLKAIWFMRGHRAELWWGGLGDWGFRHGCFSPDGGGPVALSEVSLPPSHRIARDARLRPARPPSMPPKPEASCSRRSKDGVLWREEKAHKVVSPSLARRSTGHASAPTRRA
jgi:hypothetical protein